MGVVGVIGVRFSAIEEFLAKVFMLL
jgi:hypothetical protein